MKKETSKARKRRELKLQPYGQGIFALFRKQRPLRLETRYFPELREMLGDDVLIGFVQAFNAAERLDAFAHLLEMNWDVAKKGGIAHARNHRTILFTMFGVLHEAMGALEVLHTSAGMNGLVGKTFPPWKHLQEMRLRWKKDLTLKTIREALGNHLGDADEIKAGLATIKPGKRVAIIESDGAGIRSDSSYPIALTILMGGLPFDVNHYASFFAKARTDQFDLGTCLQALFIELLWRAGVKIFPFDEAEFAKQLAAHRFKDLERGAQPAKR